MEMKQLESFEAVVRTGSFTKAAQLLYLSQPTVSIHVRQLEEQLGVQLLERSTRGIRLTDKGKDVYQHARDILVLRDRMVTNCSPQPHTILRLGASTIPANYLLPRLLPEFGRQYPDIYFSIRQSNSPDIRQQMIDGLLDLGLVSEVPEEDTLSALPFYRDRMVLITPVTDRYLALDTALPCPIQSLLAEPFILRETPVETPRQADRYLAGLGIDVQFLRVAARVNDQETVKRLVAGGMGISLISEIAARDYVQEKRLLMFELPEDSLARTLYLITPKGTATTSGVKQFTDFVTRFFETA